MAASSTSITTPLDHHGWSFRHPQRWKRFVADSSKQEIADIDELVHATGLAEPVREFFNRTLTPTLESVGLNGVLQDLVAHRLQPDDVVEDHDGMSQDRFHFRCMLGVSPGSRTGGELRMRGTRDGPLLPVRPGFGEVFVIEPAPRAFHDIERVRAKRSILTVVGFYLDLARKTLA
ncbi:hypothetical protein JOF56_009905 [Kibdelosporangium banguiense]|uniref:2OG-Fe(II) oxygenase n=1 Tax=Kibdelosporangium banguiense TaxID=1365924 RepID=A0ABS4TYP9_9PSEU|nr:hypothetical protein [Kibdelosporangium banguiense]MBP2329520.1 hypothetical protein [Kibdelosporangium banguiense]